MRPDCSASKGLFINDVIINLGCFFYFRSPLYWEYVAYSQHWSGLKWKPWISAENNNVIYEQPPRRPASMICFYQQKLNNFRVLFFLCSFCFRKYLIAAVSRTSSYFKTYLKKTVLSCKLNSLQVCLCFTTCVFCPFVPSLHFAAGSPCWLHQYLSAGPDM